MVGSAVLPGNTSTASGQSRPANPEPDPQRLGLDASAYVDEVGRIYRKPFDGLHLGRLNSCTCNHFGLHAGCPSLLD